MRKRCAFAGLGLLVVCGFVVWRFSGLGAGGPEDTIKEMIAALHHLADTLEHVQDAGSAEEALSRIDSAGTRLANLGKRMRDHKLTGEQQKKLAEQYEPELAAAVYRIKDATSKALQRAPGKAQQIA